MDAGDEKKADNLDEDEEEEVEKIDPRLLKPDLYAAAVANDTKRVQELIDEDVPPTYVDTTSEWTPLHWAAIHGNEEMTKSLIAGGACEPYHRMVDQRKRNADVHNQNKSGASARIGGASQMQDGGSLDGDREDDDDAGAGESKFEGDTINEGDEEEDEEDAVPEVEDVEKKLEVSVDLTKNTPLLWAASKGFLQIIWQLLMEGYSPNDVDSMGNNALHLASTTGDAKVLQVLIDDGASANAVNHYKNLPIDMAKTKDMRDMLSVAMVSGASNTAEDITLKHEQNMKEYNRMVYNLSGAITEAARINSPRALNNLSLSNTNKLIRSLSDAISVGKEFCLESKTIREGEDLLLKLETSQELVGDIMSMQQHIPIRTQSVFIEYVYKLEKTIQRAEKAGIDRHHLQLGTDLVARCQIEYWLSTLLTRLKDVVAADDTHEHDMNRLRQAIQKAQALRSSEVLTEEAGKFLRRLEAELGMYRALKNIPAVKLPIESPPAGYWEEKDTGKIMETEGYPLPPVDTGEYIWIPAESYTSLGQSIERLKTSYNGAEQLGANPDIIEGSKLRLVKAEKDFKILEAKDAADKQAAIEVAKKQAKKLKKGKKKK